jgi:putative ABC transport system permease protein
MATIAVVKQFDFLVNQDLGYNDKNMVTISTGRMETDQLNMIKQDLQANTGVDQVTARQGGSWSTMAKASGNDISFALDVVDTDYLETLQIPLIRGRNFSSDLATDSTSSVLVNESFVKKAGWKDGLGEEVDFFYDEDRKYHVVGIMKDYHYGPMTEKIGPQMFIMDPRYEYGQLLIRIQPQDVSATLRHIEQVVNKYHPFIPYQYIFKDEENVKQYEAESKWRQIISSSALITIFVSCIGLFGLATLSAEKRVKEIGIRKVLGASRMEMAQLLSADFLKLALLASVIAIPAAWWAMKKWLENYPYRITIGPGLFLAASLFVVVVALVTVSFQAIRTAGTNPADSLRSE